MASAVDNARAPTPAEDGDDIVLLPEREPYDAFAKQLQETCLVNDPWYEGEPIFRSAPAVVKPAFLDKLYAAAGRVGALFDELCSIVQREPALLDDFFRLPPYYKLMWLSSDGWWHAFARMDMFELDDGSLQVCELNADTPTGQIETLVPAELIRDAHPTLEDPNADYLDRLWEVMGQVHHARTGHEAPKTIGLVYPTDLPEDITLIRLYQRAFEARGANVILGSPYNLHPEGDGVGLFGTRVDLVFRMYKTDWWGERPEIFSDEDPVPDPAPLARELNLLLKAERRGAVTVVNPFGSLLPQDKLALAFLWEEMERFSPESQRTIRDLIPETRRVDGLDRAQLKAERERWVLKSDFGCEGDEVMVGMFETDDDWADAIDAILPGVWVVQRYFEARALALPDLDGAWQPNYGIYLLGGVPGGVHLRVSPRGVTTGYNARVATVLVGDGRQDR